MFFFVSNPGDLAITAPVGDFVTPSKKAHFGKTEIWAADNDCFSGFKEDQYVKMLKGIRKNIDAGLCSTPVFVTMPDVVGDYQKTIALFGVWHRVLARYNLPRGFVLQDGAEKEINPIPWNFIEALFVGGSTGFKLSEFVADCVKRAKYHGKWVHMGRVNSFRRLKHARVIGCDSVDGSSYAKFREARLIPAIRQLDQQVFVL